ncbi:MAG: phospholipase D family protein [Proteobacteria bacterium]|nr:phospholipase D family protein [Pseudomonadota bacterium]
MEGLYTNRNIESDFFRNALYSSMDDIRDVFVAVAFFTDDDVVKTMTENGCHVRLIVRLGFPTSPSALRELMKNSSVEIRFFTSPSFHPKLYIFGDKLAFVGSANLTTAALLTNQEVIVSVDSEDARFAELGALFASYWDQSRVLTDEELEKYEEIHQRHKSSIADMRKSEKEIANEIGDVNFANINRGQKKKSQESLFIDTYRKSYQESVAAFHKVRSVYESIGLRKADENLIPLRLEVDSFFSFVRDTFARKESWREQAKGWDNQSERRLRAHIQEWHETERPYFNNTIVNVNYPLIQRVFSSPDSIQSSEIEEIIEAIVVLHSFHDRLRFFPGGLETLKSAFREKNSVDDVKNSLSYLLYGVGDIVKRMCDLIYDDEYKLAEFGPANVQEMVGWVNREELPVVNGRTTKVLRFYGFDVRQV